MKRLVLLLAASLGTAAFGQTVSTLTLRAAEDANADTVTFRADRCNETISVQWRRLTTLGSLCTGLKLWSTSGECGDAPTTDSTSYTRYEEVPLVLLQSAQSGSFDVKIAELPDFKVTAATDGGTGSLCGADRTLKTHRVCGQLEYTTYGFCGTSNQKLQASALKLVYDTLPPSPPTMGEPVAQDEAVRVPFSVDSDTTVVVVEAMAQGGVDYAEVGDAAASSDFVVGRGLANGTTYDVRLRAKDAAGNVSDPTAAVAVTPIRTVGLWGYYKDAGGTETAGCSSAGLGGLGPALALLGALRWRRRQVRRGS